jgi:hypothetical protein
MNVLISSPELYSAIFAKNMQLSSGWNPVYFLTKSSNYSYVKEEFPEAIRHNFIDSIKGIFPNKEVTSNAFDLSLLDEIDLDFTIAISLLDRNDSNSYSFHYKERLSFCNDLINQWYSVLTHYKIDTVLFQEEPHQCSTYILYKVAQHLNIKTLMVVRTISDLGVIPKYSIETPNEKLLSLYKANIKKFDSTGKLDLNERLSQYLGELSGDYDKVLKKHLWNQLDSYKNILHNNNFMFAVLKVYGRKIINKLRNLKPVAIESDQKETHKTFSDSKKGYYSYQKDRIQTTLNKRRLYETYKSMASIPNLKDTDYVLCALQYQPEKSTCPNGGKFNDQRLMIKSLRSVLPPNVKIIVKEHPSQFIFDFARYGEYFRDENYYQSILDIPNVELLDMKTNIYDYIDGCLFVASVTGTICWEAVNRQKPSLSFGYSWMSGCEGIYDVTSHADLINAVDSILQKKPRINTDYVKIFAKTIFDLGFSVAVGGAVQLKHKNVSDTQNALFLEKAINWLEE